jgi:hypothetical protein
LLSSKVTVLHLVLVQFAMALYQALSRPDPALFHSLPC